MKRHMRVRVIALLAPFPPRSCGGLIEAVAPQPHRPQIAPFPPAFVRGPH